MRDMSIENPNLLERIIEIEKRLEKIENRLSQIEGKLGRFPPRPAPQPTPFRPPEPPGPPGPPPEPFKF